MEKDKEVKEETEYYCEHCKALTPSACFCDESFDEDDEDFEDDESFDECGMMADGTCSMIGSEYCDWECKHSRRSLWKK